MLAGFVYVNSDAGWQPAKPGRNSSGWPVPDPKCPMPATAQSLHARGFKMGLYSALSSVQCGVAPGGLYHEDIDAAAYASWGLDYLKYDNCAEYALEPNARSTPMRDALNRTHRPILFSTEPFHLTPNPQAHISNLWRTTTDVAADVFKVRVNIDLNDKWAEYAGPGGFNDPDMLQCGKGKSTLNQHRSNFITWSIAKAPLLLSANLTDLAEKFPSLLKLLTNADVIAINQDPMGVQARKIQVDGLPIGKLVGVERCAEPDMMAAAAATVGSQGEHNSMREVNAAKQQWSAVPVPGSATGAVQFRHGFYAGRCLSVQPPNPIAYNPPYRHPTRPHPRPVWSAHWQAVLSPCDSSDPKQRWSFLSPGLFPSEKKNLFSRRTLSALINEAASIGNASALTVLPETDSRYGVNHVGSSALEYPDAEGQCKTRGCEQYAPSQMWVHDAVTGQILSGNYTASINEQWLTTMVPAPTRRCLQAIASADMAGTPAGHTEVWAGPLANGSLVVALQNREDQDNTTISVSVAALSEPNAFFSFAMLRAPAARANGYARGVPSPPPAAKAYTVHDVLLGKDVGVLQGEERLSAQVATGDTKLFVLRPGS